MNKLAIYKDRQLSDEVAYTPRIEKIDPRPLKVGSPNFHSDVGFADAFATRYQNRIRYIREEGKWLIFRNDTGWQRDRGGEALALISEYTREIHAELTNSIAVSGFDEGKMKLVRGLGSLKKMQAALQICSCNPEVAVSQCELDFDPDLLGVQNGVVNLRDGTFTEHAPDLLVTRQCACGYDPDAGCPRFLEFLSITQPNPEIRDYLQRLAGYSFTGLTTEHILPFHYGAGGNGKGTFLERCILKMSGSYARKLTDRIVYSTDHGPAPDLEIAGLQGYRFVLGEENARGGALNERFLKAITGEDQLKGRKHYQEFDEFTPTAKVHLVGNHLPRIVGTDEGIWRRFYLIPWEQRLPNNQGATNHSKILEGEFSGILNWVIAGAREFYRTGTNPPALIIARSESFRNDSDTVGTFLREKTTQDPGGVISKGDLYSSYTRHCEENGIQPRFRLSKKSFGMDLKGRGMAEETRNNIRLWIGIRMNWADG